MQKRECAARSIINSIIRSDFYGFKILLVIANYTIVQRNINLRLIEEKWFIAILVITVTSENE